MKNYSKLIVIEAGIIL